tara:strand:- start:805 stop:1035 length:231 start_codon:yes stop_codon:yes gene_type:complete
MDKKLVNRLIFVFLLSIAMTMIMTFAVTLSNIGFSGIFFYKWLLAWLIACSIAIPVSLLLSPLIQKIANKITKTIN